MLKKLTTKDTQGDILACLEQDGAVIISDMVSEDILERFKQDIEPHFQAHPEFEAKSDKPFIGALQLFGLLGRSRAVLDILTDTQLVPIVRGYLDIPRTHYEDENPITVTTEMQLSLGAAFRIRPGTNAQILHRDDALWDITHPVEREPTLHSLTAVTPFTEANGGTRLIPGSHKWDNDRGPKVEETIAAEMPAGATLLYFGSIYHGGGRNITTHEKRTAINLNFIHGYLRQEENQYLTYDLQTAKRFPEDVQKLIGYNIAAPFCGYVDLKDPIYLLA